MLLSADYSVCAKVDVSAAPMAGQWVAERALETAESTVAYLADEWAAQRAGRSVDHWVAH